MDVQQLTALQRSFYHQHKTKEVAYRRAALKKLRGAIMAKEADIKEALYQDLHKSSSESYMSEIGMVLSELTFQLRHIEAWSKPKRKHTPLAQFHAVSYTVPQPYGVVLVMAPWNYPFQLCMEPLIGAIAAGNTVILKPSAYAPHTSAVIKELISSCFKEEYIAVVEGGRKENKELLEQRFDYIFFTGGVEVGRQVMEKASRYLTPVSLELGGKSPCIVEESADIRLAAKRIVFGKFLNAGQTCVAPDYVLVQRSMKNELLCYLKDAIHKAYGSTPIDHPDYPGIINEKHFERLCGLMKEGNICIGGRTRKETLQIEPTVIEGVEIDHRIMQEEIFGPLLPILVYDDLEDVIDYINAHEHPLALYLFTKDTMIERRILKECSFGGGCINDTIIHLASSHMGFGGVGQSGMGSYHGYDSFQTFSHQRSIVKKSTWMDLPFRYPPYSKAKDAIIRLFMK